MIKTNESGTHSIINISFRTLYSNIFSDAVKNVARIHIVNPFKIIQNSKNFNVREKEI
jgi:hypothetical protein